MSFVTVRYADNQAKIFNPNCRNGVLLGYIKQRCGLNINEDIDLSDEKGSVKQLHCNLEDYGTAYLKDREILILLKVNRDMAEDMNTFSEHDVTYTPLIEALTLDTQFMGQLNPGATKSPKKSAGAKKSASTQINQQKKEKTKAK